MHPEICVDCANIACASLDLCFSVAAACNSDNIKSSYLKKGEAAPEEPAVGIQVSAAITSSFFVLIGIFFPSVTGR